jgi:hypothetical protein
MTLETLESLQLQYDTKMKEYNQKMNDQIKSLESIKTPSKKVNVKKSKK